MERIAWVDFVFGVENIIFIFIFHFLYALLKHYKPRAKSSIPAKITTDIFVLFKH